MTECKNKTSVIVPVIVLICVKVKITKQTTKENEGFKQDVWGNFKNCKKLKSNKVKNVS